jgi:hypothetical protein
MKKIIVTALALVIGTATLLASNLNPDDSNKNIRNQILKLMDAPDFSINEETTVTIIFTFDSENEIIVLNVDSKDGEILNYVRKNLNHKVISNPGERDKLYSIPLTIK